ncbi:hypothetical protein [Galactobacter valiniphilus]|uniref:hypothetical protein n=1 Tax=Galactobacter valiniphilus TaxID=2676122 RepID=UPI0037355214
MPAPHPQDFRDFVVTINGTRADYVTLKQIAADSGISVASLSYWLTQADVEAWKTPCMT